VRSLYFADTLLRGCRATKVDASGLRAFASPNMAPLAAAGINVSVRWDLVAQHSDHPAHPFAVKSSFNENVVIIRIFPGTFKTLRNTLQPPLQGAILQTFGCGNAPDNDPELTDALREATDRGVVIVSVTQVGIPSWNRSILTEIYPCHVCSYQEIHGPVREGHRVGALRHRSCVGGCGGGGRR
jgi:L-asparaginase/Glu-tRNA(Gln) amidotransferase subunit D